MRIFHITHPINKKSSIQVIIIIIIFICLIQDSKLEAAVFSRLGK